MNEYQEKIQLLQNQIAELQEQLEKTRLEEQNYRQEVRNSIPKFLHELNELDLIPTLLQELDKFGGEAWNQVKNNSTKDSVVENDCNESIEPECVVDAVEDINEEQDDSSDDEPLPDLDDLLDVNKNSAPQNRDLPSFDDLLSDEAMNEVVQIGNLKTRHEFESPLESRVISPKGIMPTIISSSCPYVLVVEDGNESINEYE